MPRTALKSIGLQPQGKRTYELADGSEIRFDIAVARVEFMGEFVGATILFGEDDTEPLLGVTALESVGIEVDPLNQTLKRLPAVPAQRLPAPTRHVLAHHHRPVNHPAKAASPLSFSQRGQVACNPVPTDPRAFNIGEILRYAQDGIWVTGGCLWETNGVSGYSFPGY